MSGRDVKRLTALIDEEIARRIARATTLADRYPDLGGHTRYDQFLLACLDVDLDLDFVTSSALFDEFARRRGDPAPARGEA
jgi:hypothetical protein